MNIDIFKYGEKYRLTEAEELALKFIVNNLDKSLELGVRGVAKECFASSSVIMNLSKKLGYKGFIDMVYKLEYLIKNDNTQEKKEDLFTNLENHYSKETENFIKLLKDFRNRPIYVNGVGFSRIAANYFADKLKVLGFFAMFTEYMECVENPRISSPLLIVISKSGETSGAISLCEKSQKNKATIVSFVGNKANTIKNLSDISFVVKNKNPMDDRNIEENDYFANCILLLENLLAKFLATSENESKI